MVALSPETTVGQLVADRPARSRLFERLGLDYCCGGKKPLAEACAKHDLDVQTVLRLLEALEDGSEQRDPTDASKMSLIELADHIEATHHTRLREELPRLQRMATKVAAVHGEGEPRLHSIRDLVRSFSEELFAHMAREERVLFPIIRQLEADEDAGMIGALTGPVHQMESEHEQTGDALSGLRELTDGFTPPQWACNTFRALYDGLRELEQDMHQHVHKENNVLFPRALALEAGPSEKEVS